jgi:hypothetical protein
MSQPAQSADQFRDSRLADLHRTVRFDRALWGVGKVDEARRCMQINLNGSALMQIVEGEAQMDPEGPAFMTQYNAYQSREDVIGRLFVHLPKVVQVVDVKKASSNRSTYELWKYLEKAGVAHLLLVGIYSSFGYAWTTLYRRNADNPFRLHQVEYASRSIPDALYRWQLLVAGLSDGQDVLLPEKDEPCPTTTSSLTNREILVLLGFMNGLSAEEIVDQLVQVDGQVISEDSVYQAHRSAKKKLHGAVGLFGGRDRTLNLRTF